jgi:hypothetical protein
LGQHAVPTALRERGLVVRTLADIYGAAEAQEISDVEWIALAGKRDWVVLTKDGRIRLREAERLALEQARVRAFCLVRQDLTFAEQAGWLVTNINRILQRARKPGPYFYGVYRDHIEKLWPRDH